MTFDLQPTAGVPAGSPPSWTVQQHARAVLAEYALEAEPRGLDVPIAEAGAAACLSEVLAAATTRTSASNVAIDQAPVAASVSPAVALARLKAGNARFVTNPVSQEKPTAIRRSETAQDQRPFAIIVGCADSRTAPELVFDQNIGDLFVFRTAGNLIDDHALGGIEFAVERLGARLIVVLGHKRCGAVIAALGSAKPTGHIGSLVRDIQPAVEAARSKPGDGLANTVKENANLVAQKIRKEAELGELAPQVLVVTGYYDLDSGAVEWLAEEPIK